jgi:hypothetical protein
VLLYDLLGIRDRHAALPNIDPDALRRTKSPKRSLLAVLDVGHGRALLGKCLLLDFHRQR